MSAYLLHVSYDADERSADDAFAATSPRIEKASAAALKLLAAGKYWVVAEINQDALDKRGYDNILEAIYDCTQNGRVSPSWSRMPPAGIKPVGDGTVKGGMGYKTTSMGDIVVVDGEFHLVAMFGFHSLGKLPIDITAMESPKDGQTPASPRI